MLYRDKEANPVMNSGGQVKVSNRELHQSLELLHSKIRELHDRISGAESQFSPVCRDPSPQTQTKQGPADVSSFCEVGRQIDQAITGVQVALDRLENLIDRSQV